MSLIYADRVKELSNTYGTTDTITLAGPIDGFQSFSSVMDINDVCYYCIDGLATGEWETGLGTLTTTTSLVRTVTTASSNAGNPVDFLQGTKHVYLTVSAGAIDALRAKTRLVIMSQNSVENFDCRQIVQVSESSNIENYNKVPEMTDYTTPSGTVSVSTADTTYYGWNAFDSTTNEWRSTALPAYITYEFDEGQRIAVYSIQAGSDASYAPKSWVLYGSNDGVSWTPLDTQTDILVWNSVNSYTIGTPAVYTHYKIEVSAVVEGTYTSVWIDNIELLSPEDVGTSNFMPVMTSSTSNLDFVSFENPHNATLSYTYRMFDADKYENHYATIYTEGTNDNSNAWVAMHFVTPKTISGMKMKINYGTDDQVVGYWSLQGSNDSGLTWDTVFSIDSSNTTLETELSSWHTSKERTFSFIESAKTFLSYRLYFRTMANGSEYNKQPLIVELELYAANVFKPLTPGVDYEIRTTDITDEIRNVSVVRLKPGTGIFHTIDYI